MADNTKIEWADATWNPITGCSVVSAGCTNCYAMQLAGTRLAHTESRKGLTKKVNGNHVWTGEVRLNESMLEQPLKWKNPRKIFVCAHGDLFHENVPELWIDRVFAVMALASQHIFQVLTKRPARMLEYLRAPNFAEGVARAAVNDFGGKNPDAIYQEVLDICQKPLPNVWLGVSVENQETANERIPLLLDTPAAVRFISAEPLLGEIDLRCVGQPNEIADHDALVGTRWPKDRPDIWLVGRKLDWVIVGGESGQKARPMHPDWVRKIRDDCQAANVPLFFKQWGNWKPCPSNDGEWPTDLDGFCRLDIEGNKNKNGWPLQRLPKQTTGNTLDGVQHLEFPKEG